MLFVYLIQSIQRLTLKQLRSSTITKVKFYQLFHKKKTTKHQTGRREPPGQRLQPAEREVQGDDAVHTGRVHLERRKGGRVQGRQGGARQHQGRHQAEAEDDKKVRR